MSEVSAPGCLVAAKGGKERPFKQKGTQSGTWTASGWECLVEDPPDGCIFSYQWDGRVIGSHIGKGSVASVNDGSGEFTEITAANGDKITSFVTEPFPKPVTACPDVPGFNYSAPFKVQDNYYDGTGRFEGAKGTTVSVGCFYLDFTDFNDLTFPAYVTFTATGTISY